MRGVDKDAWKEVLKSKLDGNDLLDDDFVTYLTEMLSESLEENPIATSKDDVYEQLEPFLESSGCSDEFIDEVSEAVSSTLSSSISMTTSSSSRQEEVKKLKQGVVSMMLQDTTSAAEEDANRFMWGTDKGVAAFTNSQKEAESSTISAKEKRKQRQELQKERRQLSKQDDKEDEDAQQVSAMVLPDYSSNRRERDIHVRNCSLSLDSGASLLDQAELKFAHGRRYGLVGKNGIGKTTLLKAIASMELTPDFPKHHRILHVRQEVRMSSNNEEEQVSVLQTVLNSHVERNALLQREKELLAELEIANDDDGDVDPTTAQNMDTKKKLLEQKGKGDADFQSKLKELDQVYATLQMLSSDSAESTASIILSGLQFTPQMQAGPLSALSGGWRMRVSLAAALLIEPDLLMLDEPTNHLDLEAVLWLEQYLIQYPHTLVVVSHDRQFLNEVCTDTIQFVNQSLVYYKGSYDIYVKTSKEQLKNQVRVYEAYMEKRTHLMEFIEKFRANAKRATLVQSRIKTVEKMDAEAPPPVEIEPVWKFSIPNPEPIGRPIISVDDVTFDYDPNSKKKKESSSPYLLEKVNFGIDFDTRMGILGPNGAGKSTLLNLIIGVEGMNPSGGSVSRNGKLRLGHFTQHSSDKFDLTLSSVENILNMFEKSEDGNTTETGVQQVRSFLGKFQIQGIDAVKPMAMLSGGQKSRVAFAALAYQKPHVIIMDEPTNHLDMESIDALVEALQNYKGGLVCVSHDQYFITQTCRDLWVVGNGQCSKFRGGFTEYKQLTLDRISKRVAENVHKLSNLNK